MALNTINRTLNLFFWGGGEGRGGGNYLHLAHDGSLYIKCTYIDERVKQINQGNVKIDYDPK